MVDTKKYKSLDACKERLDVYLENNLPVPPELQEAIDYWEKKESPISTSDNEYFYRTFIHNSKFEVKPDKIDCIRETVDHLLEDGENAKDPVLLLGKIQCGKTDTFEAVICLAFDRGIDIAVVFTKGTRTLTEQTIKRLKEDFHPFAKNKKIGSKSIYIDNILNVYENLAEARVNKNKIVIVCKKEKTNLDHLIELFEKNLPVLKDKKVLIVDDEADFASINYKKEASGIDLAKISAQIETFKKVPKYCRYLEVTATPYALYLQPTGEIKIINGFAQTLRPRFTALVPAHEMYIGGEQYFEKSENTNSMYSSLFHAIDKRCMSELAKADNSNLRLGIRKGDIYDLTEALISYFVAVAIRSIQVRKEKEEVYPTAALFHIDINRTQHEAQEQLIKKMVDKDLKKVFLEDKDRKNQIVWSAVDYYIEDFKKSNENGRIEGLISVDFPEKEEIIDEIRKIFSENDYYVKRVNSDRDMVTYLDQDTGELELTHKATIFIGGSILDRGITVKNMLCFFYGRNPKVFQQDTVLQHARMYGARSKEDMAVTRFHTTMRIYDIMKRIHKRDSQLREWIKAGKDVNYNNAYFLTYDKDCKPCATSKIRASNAITLRGGSRFLPRGFFTKSNADIKSIVAKIDNIIESSPKYIQDGYFEMDQATVFKILELIESTYFYDKKYENLEQEDDMTEVRSAAIHCGEKSGGKFSVIVKTNREANRILQNGAWADTPYTGEEHQEAVENAKNNKMPVLMLFRENGDKCFKEDRKSEAFKGTKPRNIGWNDAPFYWPVLFVQPDLESVMFAINQRPDDDPTPVVEREDILEGINPEEVLKLTYKYDLIDHFGKVGRVYDPTDEIYDDPYETRAINTNTASRYLVKTTDGRGYKLKPGITIDKKHDHGLYSYNNGEFPFVLRPFKYMLLTKGRTGGCEQMLLKLTDPKYWHINPSLTFSDDGDMVDFITGDVIYGVKETVLSKNMRLRERFLSDVCQWTISYQVQEVLKYLPKVKVDNTDIEDDQ